MNQKPTITVAAALIFDTQNCVLITQRPMGSHLAGMWEFPGGCIEENETPQQALQREIKEEIGIDVTVGQLYLRESFAYDIKNIDISFYLCSQADSSQQPQTLEVADWRFVNLSGLQDYSFPPADQNCIKRLFQNDFILNKK